MIVIYPNKARLLTDFATSLVFGGAMLGFAAIILFSGTRPLGIALLGAFLALIGLGLLTVAAGALYWIVSRKPLIRADSENLEVHTIIGTVLKTRWSNISKIYVVTEQEHPTRSWIKVRKIYFRRTSEKDQAITPLIDIPEYRLGITFDEMRKEILSFPAADLVADDSFRNAPTEPILSRIEKVYTAGRYAVIALICGYSLYIFVSIQPRVQSALDLRPTRVEIRCNRNDTDLSCNLIEYLANDGQVKQQISITGVKRFSTSGDTYTSVFLEASSPKKTRIATVNLKKVHYGWDSEKREPLGSLNRLKAFIEKSNDKAIVVSYLQPDI